ncbi:hypothetical protein [uncultured Clostridium sp.]|uniref:hypothetical protein n=1 Tax=uncultured Clostridium sp. TaxID=59620 RepID=UPI0025D5B0BF|nr:hypothetical protein [uncultured Clostridium sp.]
MDYFLLKQDERYYNTPHIKDLFKKIDKRDLTLVRESNISDTLLYIKHDDRNECLDILDTQIFLVSEEIKNILEKYNANVVFKMIVLVDFKIFKQYIYYLPIFEEIESLNDKSEFNLNKTIVKKIVLDSTKVKDKKMFKIKESDKTLIVVRLDVAESLLRRNFKGISLKRLEVL